jgi:DNA-binding transcriptional regulator LsrR (DeoR family)
MALTEKEMKDLEDQIPQLAREATANAFKRAIASGDTVVIAQGGKIYQINPDGSRFALKDLKVVQRKTKGKIIKIH